MKTLVYFASGSSKKEYKNLNFDRIYLVDYIAGHYRYRKLKDQKEKFTYVRENFNNTIISVKLDCLDSIEFFKREKVQIDCFVSLNEGLFEGGGIYAINSDMFLGYAMPLFKEKYIHIMNKMYYCWQYHVTMDLPYNMEEIKENDERYINPKIFSDFDFAVKDAKVFQMSKIKSEIFEYSVNQKLKLKIIHDSIWNDYDNLDALVISIKNQGQGDFFDRIPKVINFNKTSLEEIFNYCEKYRVKRLGFTPFGRGEYYDFLKKLENLKNNYPEEIIMYHLNKGDYKQIKGYFNSNNG